MSLYTHKTIRVLLFYAVVWELRFIYSYVFRLCSSSGGALVLGHVSLDSTVELSHLMV
jgi:hypothetical protein